MSWKNASRSVGAGLLMILQYVALTPTLPVLALRLLLRASVPLERWWIQHVYYRVTVWRRRAAGEDLWKEIDWQLGIGPPEGHPQYIPPEGLQGAGLVAGRMQPMCHVCRATPGFVEVCEACRVDRGCVAHGMTGCAPCDHCQIVPCGTCDGPTACCHPEEYETPEHQCRRCAHAKERKAS